MFIVKQISALLVLTSLGLVCAPVHAQNGAASESDQEIAAEVQKEKERLKGFGGQAASKEIALETQQAKKYAERRDYAGALKHYQKALQLVSEIQEGAGQELIRQDIVRYKNEIGIIYLNMGKYAEAREILTSAAESAEKEMGNEDSRTAAIYSNLGSALRHLGAYEKALDWNMKSVAIREKLAPDSVETAETCSDIAFLHDSLGDYREALEWYDKALIVRETALGAEHPSTAAASDNIALMHERLGERAQAQTWRGKAVSIREKAGGRAGTDDYKKIVKAYKEELAAEEKTFGKQHPITAATSTGIAEAYDKAGDHKQAAIWYRKTLAANEKTLGKEHPSTVMTYNNIAVADARQGNYKLALENLQRAVRILEKSVGEDHPDTAMVYNNIAWVYSMQRDYLKAGDWAWRALVINEKVLGNEHPATGKSYANVAMTYFNRREYGEALPGYLKAYRVYRAQFGENHPQTKQFRTYLERTYGYLHEKDLDAKPFSNWLEESPE